MFIGFETWVKSSQPCQTYLSLLPMCTTFKFKMKGFARNTFIK